MAHDPLSPSEALLTPIGAAAALVSLLAFLYSIAIVGQVLLGVIAVAVLSVGPYLSYRLLAVLDAIADGTQRLADARERGVAEESRFGSTVEGDATGERDSRSSRSSDRVTERER
jgi:hypothetical protein